MKSVRSTASWLAILCLAAALPHGAGAHNLPVPGPLSSVPVPEVPGLVDGKSPVIVDPGAALVLGKALFWDEGVGSDGMACASCHYHAGADARVRNQLSPGTLHEGAATATTFEPLDSGAPGGPNHTLSLADFPLMRLANPIDRGSDKLFVTDDVVSSAGTFGGTFVSAIDGRDEVCTGGEDDVFHKGGVRTRRVEPRQTPSVFNTVFFHRQFLDGRASNLFNGVNHTGDRDAEARVFIRKKGSKAKPKKLYLENASLAAQAVVPPLSPTEMSCEGRTFPDIGRKLLDARPLEAQAVHPDDSVLGDSRDPSGLGLETTYRALVEQAFDERYWSATKGDFGATPDGAPYDHMEANFAFLFGLAVQVYESTLISDDAPFDQSARDANGIPTDFSAAELNGLDLFMGKAHCVDCHRGAEFSAAAISQMEGAELVPRHSSHKVTGPNFVDRISLVNGELALVDRGFMNTGVAPPENDSGAAVTDSEGLPRSYAAQYAERLAGGKPPEKKTVKQVSACHFTFPFGNDYDDKELKKAVFTEECTARFLSEIPKKKVAKNEAAQPDGGRLRVAIDAAFKVPSLRNIELTGPFMHNGSFATLRQVIDFYSRGGNFNEVQNPEMHGLLFASTLTEQEKDDLEAFLLTLTDERVRWERAPFDHPELRIPNGHVETDGVVEAGNLPGNDFPVASDEILVVPAVGRDGRTPEQGPLLPFEARIDP
ncbi:MAG: cytochrome-c peroxidase [Myxococcales bacterium]|nr:cytochrome-c peroxidase [Myxococcales bacterium]